ncbi:hypothetical protein [Desulfosporosinus sp. Sb-LF]|uniref:hypothetical protein n=1 Tax=Desulfosporosinus sp. Sb-LF TaxID=2560027 RepID=UPI00107F4AE0|nr:hypothetical protein [Desulfosporosinus sp. Sb-LF]TGE31409.1 hypothetical protein E4K68_17660 [Desulfosporosinus sp. Sb-LF]
MSQYLYMLFSGCIWVSQRLYVGGKTLVYSRREDLLGVGKGFIAVYSSIALMSQLIVKGRAKILLGVEFLTQPYVVRYMHVGMSVICSREVVYSWVDIL